MRRVLARALGKNGPEALMSTIENNFAAGTANISGGFDGSILGQANRIASLQNNGNTQAGGGAQRLTVEQGIQMLNRDPSLMPQAIQALQDPQILRQVLATLQQKPELVQMLPQQLQQFLHFLLSGGTGR
jgi:hypothetical protein